MTKAKATLAPDISARLAAHAKRSKDAMRRASSVKTSVAAAPLVLSDPPVASDAVEPAPPAKGRKSMKAVVIYLAPAAKDQFVRIAREKRMTVQELGIEAINLLFQSYKQKPIA